MADPETCPVCGMLRPVVQGEPRYEGVARPDLALFQANPRFHALVCNLPELMRSGIEPGEILGAVPMAAEYLNTERAAEFARAVKPFPVPPR